jgi:hypothetical protein
MSKKQRDIGKRGERIAATAFRQGLPARAAKIKRGWQAADGAAAPDIDGVDGWWIEVKYGKMPNPRAALKQAVEAIAKAKDSRKPVAVIIDRKKKPFVILHLEDFIPILEGQTRVIADESMTKTIRDCIQQSVDESR